MDAKIMLNMTAFGEKQFNLVVDMHNLSVAGLSIRPTAVRFNENG